MTDGEASVNVRDHGTAVDEKKLRVQCNYCCKVMSGFFRLKCHLGGVGKDVVLCEKVPNDLKESFRTMLLDAKKDNLSKEVGKLYMSNPDLPSKRTCSPSSHCAKRNKLERDQNGACGSEENADVGFVLEDGATENQRPKGSKVVRDSETKALLSRQTQKLIGRFFYETGTDFQVANSPSFKRMINASLGDDQMEFKIPTSQELKGWILQGEVNEMREYVKFVKSSWTSTGCSVLLDGWVDEKGRDLVSFVVECPKGPIYLRSADVSAITGDLDALQSLLDGVIEEVGVDNVVQVVAYSTEGWLAAISKQFVERRRTVFWSVSASHCIELMLGKFAAMESIKETLQKAKGITKFIYGQGEVLKLMRIHTQSYDLVKPSCRMKSAVPFLNLEIMVLEKKNLMDMFSSSQWMSSVLASSVEGRRVADLVGDVSFWNEAEMATKAAVPLLRVLCLINEASEPQVGCIYETMDQAKETIEKGFKSQKAYYGPFWTAIDDIWDNHLHSPLHGAAYYLNPSLFYSTDFCSDTEVAFGLLCCIVRMDEHQPTQDAITSQLDEYRHAEGAFAEGSRACKRRNIHPAQWWSTYGKQCPELQRFAIRILSQTCDGAQRYRLKRDLAEKVVTGGRNRIEQRRLSDLEFVHYNLQLQDKLLGAEGEVDPIPMDEWMVEREQEEVVMRNKESECTEPSNSVEGPSATEVKEEQQKMISAVRS